MVVNHGSGVLSGGWGGAGHTGWHTLGVSGWRPHSATEADLAEIAGGMAGRGDRQRQLTQESMAL